jgi:hypothetical protein
MRLSQNCHHQAIFTFKPMPAQIDFIKKIYLFTQLLSTATSSRKDDSGTGKAPPSASEKLTQQICSVH